MVGKSEHRDKSPDDRSLPAGSQRELWYKCGYCNKSFATNCDRNKHEKVHTRPYKCHKCTAGFPVRKDLTRHMTVHDGEGSLKCEQCDKKFKRKDNLLRHVKKQHP